jgi:hypothetical protein
MLWGGIGWVEKSEKGATVAGDVRMLPILPLIATCILLASPPKPLSNSLSNHLALMRSDPWEQNSAASISKHSQ